MVPSVRLSGACRHAVGDRPIRHALVATLLGILLACCASAGPAFAQSTSGGNSLLSQIFPFLQPKPRQITPSPSSQFQKPAAGQPLKIVPAGLEAGNGGLDGGVGDPAPAAPHTEPPSGPGRPGTVTMCVRLCDGYYWPISNAVRPANLRSDRELCESTCAVPAKLYIQYSFGGDAGQMRDLDGKPYKKLKTAFLYRKQFVPSCRCKAEPWSDAEQARHDEYAMREEAKRLNAELEAEMAQASAAAMAEEVATNEVAPTVADATVGPLPSLPVTKDGPNPPSLLPATKIKRIRLPALAAIKAPPTARRSPPAQPSAQLVAVKMSPGSVAATLPPRKKTIKDPRQLSVHYR